MRFAALFCACAVLLAAGCTAGEQCRTQLTAKQEWEALCRRMPQRRMPGTADEPHLSSLSRDEEAVLRRAADGAVDSVVQVRTIRRSAGGNRDDFSEARKASSESGGTGVVISADGLILTNEHVVRDAEQVSVLFHGGGEYAVEAIAVHPQLDIAVLRIEQTELQPHIPNLERATTRTVVVAISGAFDRPGDCYRTGVVTHEVRSLQRELDPAGRRDYRGLVESTAKLEPGFSGGPLLDATGHLVGLNVAVAGPAGTDRCRGYAIPFDERMLKAIEQLVTEAKAPGLPIGNQLNEAG